MLALEDRLETTSEIIPIELLVSVNERHQIDWALADEDDVTIFDFSSAVIGLHNSTLTHAHRLEQVISSDMDRSLPLCFESYDSVVIEATWEVDMVSVTPMRKLSRLIKGLVPLSSMHLALSV